MGMALKGKQKEGKPSHVAGPLKNDEPIWAYHFAWSESRSISLDLGSQRESHSQCPLNQTAMCCTVRVVYPFKAKPADLFVPPTSHMANLQLIV